MKRGDVHKVIATIEGYEDFWPVLHDQVFFRLVKDGTADAYREVRRIATNYARRYVKGDPEPLLDGDPEWIDMPCRSYRTFKGPQVPLTSPGHERLGGYAAV